MHDPPDPGENRPPVNSLSRSQRRVLGVLVEKAYTVPDSYPMTLKAVTTGCNQKNNRDPVVEYAEDDVRDTLEQLRELGLVAVVHTESGRTERFRHYMRHRFTLSEPQLAILVELLLRGRQQPGELRTRASRMVPIDSQEVLRSELQGLIDLKLAQTNGPLDRRGVEVDHCLYRPNEGQTLQPLAEAPAPAIPALDAAPPRPVERAAPPPVAATADASRLTSVESAIAKLRAENQELRNDLQAVRTELGDVLRQMDQLRRDLGG